MRVMTLSVSRFAAAVFALAQVALAEGPPDMSWANRTLSLGIILFPGFEPLDVYGPLEIFFSLSYPYRITLSTISFTAGPVTSRSPPHMMSPDMPPMVMDKMISPALVASHTLQDAPALDVIMVPGGLGNRALAQANDRRIEDFLAARAPAASYVLSVCTGATTLARAGLLEGKRATTNKEAWAGATAEGKNVTWVPTARWVEDGKIWTSSGVQAGMDMAYAFAKRLYGISELDNIMNNIEYAPHTDPHWDPFSVVHNVPGAIKPASLADCVAPVGFH